MVHLDYRDARPIYAQIIDTYRSQISAGVLQNGDRLPSVRELASQLAINPNTIQRAYEALEAEGYVYSVPGKGSFAAPHSGVDDKRKDELLLLFDQTAAELLFLGESVESLRARLGAVEGGNTL